MILSYNDFSKLNEDITELFDKYHLNLDDRKGIIDQFSFTYHKKEGKISKTLSEFININKIKIFEILKRNGIIKKLDLKEIGFGKYSIVYELDKYKVLKLTQDETTAKQHQYIYDNMDNYTIQKNIANVYQIGEIKFSDSKKFNKLYYMICENVNPDFETYIEDTDGDANYHIDNIGNNLEYLENLEEEYGNSTDNLSKYNSSDLIKTFNKIFNLNFIRNFLQFINYYMIKEYIKNTLTGIENDLMDYIIQILYNNVKRFEDFYDFFKDLVSSNIIVKDLHPQQLAYNSDEKLKLFELDADIELPKKEIKNIIRENKN